MIITHHICPDVRSFLHKIGQWWLVVIIVFVSMFMATQACAAEDPVTPQDTNSANVEANATEGKQCTWACLKWDKLCNVDPRGVYKCRRMCANFGEVCEE